MHDEFLTVKYYT